MLNKFPHSSLAPGQGQATYLKTSLRLWILISTIIEPMAFHNYTPNEKAWFATMLTFL